MSDNKSPTQMMFADDDEIRQEAEQQSSEKASEPSGGFVTDEPKDELKNAMSVELPSKGKLGYPATIFYRDMVVKDEETLTSVTEDTYNKTLNGVLKSVLMDCEFYEELTVHDRDFLLVWIWANNYDSKKDIEIKCQSCGATETHTIDLTELPSSDIKDNIVEPFEMDTKSGNKIYVRLIRVKDELFVEEYMRKLSAKDKNKHSMEFLTLASAIELGVKMPFESKLKWLSENLTTKELAVVKNYHKYFAFGLDPEVEYKCSSCGEVTKAPIPFRASDIFFPVVSDDFEKWL